MNTLEELIYYCNEIEPVGALLLTGEWGCGKTFLIDNKLKEALNDKVYIIRFPLFGIESLDDIHNAIKQEWINEHIKNKKWNGLFQKLQSGKDAAAKMEFLPEWIKGVAATDWQSFIDVKNEIDGKPVILVFDDLERCSLDYVDVLGVINDYCENKKFHTIIIANQDKMKINTNSSIKARIETCDREGTKGEGNGNKSFGIEIYPKDENKEISYAQIKEKIIQRTVTYIPNYPEIVHTVIHKLKYEDDGYKEFVEKCEQEILELFAPDRNDYDALKSNKRPHNIRSLKCALKDFYRVYNILIKENIENIDRWFYSFIAYVISFKADIAKEGRYGTWLSDEEVRKLYPAFENKYCISAIKKWILHGVWDEEKIYCELELIKKQEAAETAVDILKSHHITDIEDDIINEGFADFLEMAYNGALSLDEYVLFILNSHWAKMYNFVFPVPIDWSKIQEGVRKSIQFLVDQRKEGQQLYSYIDDGDKAYFSEEEWRTYLIIKEFKSENVLMYSNNKKLYIEEIGKDISSAFIICQNKRFNIFDEEMAYATAKAYSKGKNSEKNQFISYFSAMWKSVIMSSDIKIRESLVGFNLLYELLQNEKDKLKTEKKTFALCHTEKLIQEVDELIKKAKKRLEKEQDIVETE